MTPRWQDVRLVARAAVVSMMMQARAESALYVDSGDKGQRKRARMVVEAIDAALARLAEPAQPSAAERWRAVPAEQRGEVLAWLSGAREAFVEEHAEASVDDVRECRDRLRAIDALLALAREAEGGR